MSTLNDGGPAFPSHGSMGEVVHEGASLRDYFATHSMHIAWLCMRIDFDDAGSAKAAARLAYMVADAMLAEREKAAEK